MYSTYTYEVYGRGLDKEGKENLVLYDEFDNQEEAEKFCDELLDEYYANLDSDTLLWCTEWEPEFYVEEVEHTFYGSYEEAQRADFYYDLTR